MSCKPANWENRVNFISFPLGEFPDKSSDAQTAKESLRQAMNNEKVKGFGDVLVAKDISQGIVSL